MMKVDQLAQIVHSAHKTYCEQIGDFSIPMWRMCDAHTQQSTIDGVVNILLNPKVTPEENHKNWMDFKLADGWQYGPEKRPELKRHPCLVAYKDLPNEQKLKDQLFLDIVLVFADEVDPHEVAAYKAALDKKKTESKVKRGSTKRPGPNSADKEALDMEKKDDSKNK